MRGTYLGVGATKVGRGDRARTRRRTLTDSVAGSFSNEKSGGVLLSRGVSSQVPSALVGLTSVFGMGTGVTPPPWPPKSCQRVRLDPAQRA